MVKAKRLLSLFDYSGNWSKYYKENGWSVLQIDIQLNMDLYDWDYRNLYEREYFRGILVAQPCDHYALAGNQVFDRKDDDGRTYEAMALTYKSLAIINYFKPGLKFWSLENPMSRIAKLVPEVGDIEFKFHPYQFAGYSDASEQYSKMTWLWGKFKKPVLNEKPNTLGSITQTKMTGITTKNKNKRSATPLGFAKAFYLANH